MKFALLGVFAALFAFSTYAQDLVPVQSVTDFDRRDVGSSQVLDLFCCHRHGFMAPSAMF